MKISGGARRFLPPDTGPAGAAPRRRGLRAAGVVIAVLLLVAALYAAAPYATSALKQGYAVLSGYLTNGSNATRTIGPTNWSTTSSPQCSSEVSVGSLVAPDITNGSAEIAYPPDYCTLASYSLQQVNQDRAANGTGPVSLGYNQAGQQHADSMLYYGYFSHFDPQGYKPYMRYTLLGGLGADYENVAYLSYSLPHFTSTSSVEQGIQLLEHSMVYNDSSCCSNGHRDNILNPLHNVVSIGVAYDSTHLYFDEEFESYYIDLNFTVTPASSSNPYQVTMTGTFVQSVARPNSIYVAFDGTPTPETTSQLNNGPHEYGPGTLVGGVLPRNFLGQCSQFAQGMTVCADQWSLTAAGVDIAFPLDGFVSTYGPGVYTIYLITGSDTNSAITTISVFVK